MNQTKHCDNARSSKVDNQHFFIQQYFLACLADFSYYVESNGEAAIIDPIRDVDQYLQLAADRNAKIKYVLETHLHADFVSGHLDLQRATQATIVFGPTAAPTFEIKQAKDGELLPLGDVHIRVDHTPGHTMESSCYVLVNKGKDYCVFTGDTLFLGEVGRPDLAVKAGEVTKEMLAEILYDSLRNKVMKYDDDVIVYPGHGAGSACGKSIGDGHCCTIGTQKQKNYALQPMSKEDFVKSVLENMPKPPQYFFHDAKLNKSGPQDAQSVIAKVNRPMSYDQMVEAVKNGAVILDTRPSIQEGIIEHAYNITFESSLVNFVGTLITPETKIVVVAAKGQEKDSVVRLIRIGYDNVVGYLEGGFETYVQGGGTVVKSVKVVSLADFIKKQDNSVYLDIRNPLEWREGIIPTAQKISLGELEANVDKIPKDKQLYVYCKFGGRAKMAMSVLLRNGFKDLVVCEEGGYQDLLDQKLIEPGIMV